MSRPAANRLVTAAEGARLLGPDVTVHIIYMWRKRGLVSACGRRGRSPLYAWADLAAVDRDVRASGKSHRRAAAA